METTKISQDIKSDAEMLLDSSFASVSAPGAPSEPRCYEGEQIISSNEDTGWYYMLLRSKELKSFHEYLSGEKCLLVKECNHVTKYRLLFKCFVYTTADHRRRIESCSYTEAEYQKRMALVSSTMEKFEGDKAENLSNENNKRFNGGGFLFIQASINELNHALDLIFPRRYLAEDVSSGKVACIPDRQMKDFIMLYESMPWNIHLMPRSIGDYAKCHQRIRITGGPFKDAEGFVVRVHRDRRLVFSLGSMVLSISGIHAFPFVPVE